MRLRGVCVAQVSPHWCSALSVCVCAGVYVVTHTFFFRAWVNLRVGVTRRSASIQRRKVPHTPTQHTFCCPFSTNFSGERGIPRILGLHRSARSTYAPHFGSLWDQDLRRTEKLKDLPPRDRVHATSA